MSTSTNSRFPISVRIPGPLQEDGCWHHEPAATRSGTRLRELADYRQTRLEAEVLAPTRGVAPTDLRLRRIISAYATLAITDPGIMTLLLRRHCRPDDEALSPTVREGLDRFVTTLQQDLTEVIQREDRIPSIDPGVAVQSLLGLIHWGVSSYRAEGSLSRDEAVAQITFLALHGLVPQPAQRTPAHRPSGRRWDAA